jgi:GGDEF domain-containing protein
VRKRLVIAGHAPEALDLLPALEANPLVDIAAILTDDPAAARAHLLAVDTALAQRFAPRLTSDLDAALAAPGLVAVIDGDASPRVRERLQTIRGLQVVTPGLARTLFGFGPVDAFSKPDLLQILREILLSAELTRDQRSVLDLVLQVAVAATGADRGSLLLWDEHEGVLRVAAALGIEEELLAKIRVAPGEGISGRAFVDRRAMLLHGKADRHRWQILRERDDVESAISAPLLHGDRVLGVLNLSHARNQRQFAEEDLRFVEELARLDARILARAEEFDLLLRDSQQNRLEAELRRTLARPEPLGDRLDAACVLLRGSLRSTVVELWLGEPETGAPVLRATSAAPRTPPTRPGPGIVGHAAVARRPVWLTGCGPDGALRWAALPLVADSAQVGLLVLHGVRDPADEHLEERWASGALALGEIVRDALAADLAKLASQRGVHLAEAMAGFATCRTARQVHDLLTTSALLLLDAQDAVLRLRDDGSSRFPVVAWSGSGGWQRPPLAEVERKLAAEAIRTRQTLRVPLPGGVASATVVEHPAAPAIATPLVRAGWVVGSLSVLGKAPRERCAGEVFDTADEEALGKLTRHAQAALAALAEDAPMPRGPAPLPDRRALRERLGIELARSRIRGHRVLLIEIEIPGLEALEAAQRQPLGLADALRERLRDFDLLARVGPERFAALVPEPEDQTETLLGRLHRALRKSLDRGLEPMSGCSVRMGYALFPDDGGDLETLEARAATPRVQAS